MTHSRDFIAAMMDHWQAREVERHAAVLASKTDYIADNARLCWQKDGLRFFLCESPVWLGYERIRSQEPQLDRLLSALRGGEEPSAGRWNGYVRFPRLPMVAPGIAGILDYVPVHGGITFCQEWWDGSVTYGFDTSHAVSVEHREIISDVEWMMAETESLGRGIQIAARFEPYYLRAGDDNRRKARVLDRMGQFLPLDITGNLRAMLHLLGGEL